MVNRRMSLPRDFTWLSEEVERRTKQRLSASTLRRFWGYVDEGVKASRFTKNVLAQFAGYRDYEHFTNSQGTGDTESQVAMNERICCEDLQVGEMIKLSWLPNRVCIAQYNGNSEFTIVESENTRLEKGMKFKCQLFIIDEPAYLNLILPNRLDAVVYVIGKKNGIKIQSYSAE